MIRAIAFWGHYSVLYFHADFGTIFRDLKRKQYGSIKPEMNIHVLFSYIHAQDIDKSVLTGFPQRYGFLRLS